VLLIDLDNCPKELAELPTELADYTRIVACYGVNEPRLSISLAQTLATAIHDGRLEFVGMNLRGKNAADFGLAFWAGRLLERMPPETEFVILSRDGGLEHVVNLLRRNNRRARRVGSVGEAATADVSDETAAEEYYTDRLRPQLHRPKRRRTLVKSLRTFFKLREGVNVERILAVLIARGWVACDSQGIVSYPETAQWAESAAPPAPPPAAPEPARPARKPAKRSSQPLFD
jgi:hypothetical protein